MLTDRVLWTTEDASLYDDCNVQFSPLSIYLSTGTSWRRVLVHQDCLSGVGIGELDAATDKYHRLIDL